jgi:hypothetical protein
LEAHALGDQTENVNIISGSATSVQTEDMSGELGCDLQIYLKYIPVTEEVKWDADI